LQTTDLLYKLAHSDDKETASKALFGLGMISAGTNNSRVSSLLKNLSLYYAEEPEMQFIIRIALGLVYSGKGILTLNQLMSGDFLINKTGVAALYILSILMLNV
jgi:26S proteasome regulatory subunit N1